MKKLIFAGALALATLTSCSDETLNYEISESPMKGNVSNQASREAREVVVLKEKTENTLYSIEYYSESGEAFINGERMLKPEREISDVISEISNDVIVGNLPENEIDGKYKTMCSGGNSYYGYSVTMTQNSIGQPTFYFTIHDHGHTYSYIAPYPIGQCEGFAIQLFFGWL